MRRAGEILLLLVACGVFCFLAGLAAGSNPTIVSGTVIDWTSARPVPHMKVYFKLLNGGKVAGYTDDRGRFTAAGPRDGCCFVLVWDKRFGTLLQAEFGGGFADVRPGWRHSGVVVPVIPSTELSGHVYGEGGKPLLGCEVDVLTGNRQYGQGLVYVNSQKTDKNGAFLFTNLGADRYFLAAPCLKSDDDDDEGIRQNPYKGWKVRKAWQTAMSAPIVLLPGARKHGVELRLRNVPQYTVGGIVLLPVHPTSILDYDFQMTEVTAVPVDPTVSAVASSLNGDACEWDGRSGRFRCDFLKPGTYRLGFHFRYEDYDESTDVVVSVEAGQRPELNLTVQMPQPRNSVSQEMGYLRLHRVCEDSRSEGRAVEEYGPRMQLIGNFWELPCVPVNSWPIKAGTHVLAASDVWYQSGDRQREIESILRQQGVTVNVQPGQTVDVSPRFLTTDEVIGLAVASLH